MTRRVPLYTTSGIPAHLRNRTQIRRLSRQLIQEIKAAEAEALKDPSARTYPPSRPGDVVDLYDASPLLHIARALSTD